MREGPPRVLSLPRPVWGVVAILCLGAASLGYYLGSQRALDEGSVIIYYAERYAAQTGEPREDCHGQPGRRAEVWLLVLCDGAAGRFSYAVGHDGRLVVYEGEEA